MGTVYKPGDALVHRTTNRRLGATVNEWPDSGRGVFAISVAAQLSGLHPQTLRIYEREGLISPDRSAGGTRLYSGQDVQRLRGIAELTGSGVNIAGIKLVLEMQEELLELRTKIERLDSELARQRKFTA
jgi:MerR family transcriptional regulator, heat shock protein HspR